MQESEISMALATQVRVRLEALADPSQVATMTAARSPGKPILGVRIPPLRASVKAALKDAPIQSTAGVEGRAATEAETLLRAADALWNGSTHEEELAACMMLRLGAAQIPISLALTWSLLLDNWLSVDELAGCVGTTLASSAIAGTADSDGRFAELAALATASSPWRRRLYVVSLITPLCSGLRLAEVPDLVDLLTDSTKPVRMGCAWMVREVLKRCPEAAEQLIAVWPQSAPESLTRLLRVEGAF